MTCLFLCAKYKLQKVILLLLKANKLCSQLYCCTSTIKPCTSTISGLLYCCTSAIRACSSTINALLCCCTSAIEGCTSTI